MSLKSLTKQINLKELDYLNYAPSQGLKALRKKWCELQREKNPSLKGKSSSLPIVTNGLTHGLYVSARLFLNPKDTIITSNFYWGNYNLMLKETLKVKIKTFELFDDNEEFNHSSFNQSLAEESTKSEQINILLNFPNNPTGYSLLKKDIPIICNTLKKYTDIGKKIVLFIDDAYFGLFFEKEIFKESLFSYCADLSKNLLAIKVDGATKEDYVWGFRCGFVTLARKNTPPSVYKALEDKLAGIIRANISNASQLSQKLLLNSLNESHYYNYKKEKFILMQNRYLEVKKFFEKKREYQKFFSPIPFNSGYFMAIKINTDIEAETMRKNLLEREGIGVIALGNKILRIAFSCLEVNQIEDLFSRIVKVFQEL